MPKENDYEYYCRMAAWWQRKAAMTHRFYVDVMTELQYSADRVGKHPRHLFMYRRYVELANERLGQSRVYAGTAMDYLEWATRSKV